MKIIRSIILVGLILGIPALPGCEDPATLPTNAGQEDPATTVEEVMLLPRPEPLTSLDPISRRLISSRAAMVAEAPDSAVAWAKYGDVCLMNLWLEEAILAYDQALKLPEVSTPLVLWRRAEALHGLGRFNDADRDASKSLSLAPEHLEGWVTLAHRRLEQGDIEGAEQALEQAAPGTVDLLRRATVSIPLALQSGRHAEARIMIDELVAERPHPVSSRLAVNVGNAVRDRDLVQAHLPNAAEGIRLFEDPWLAQLAPLARHEQADLIRAVRIRRSSPPKIALQQIRRIIAQRPRLPMLRVIAADLLKQDEQFADAKIALDAVRSVNPPDHEYWALDALVSLRLANAGKEDLREQARTSSLRAIEINPTIGYGWQIRAFVLEADEDHLGASDAFLKAAEHADSATERLRWTAEAERCTNRANNP
ncbi:MAG: hypothetical protein CMJ23_11715 [Phycisphaerae bacterium]|nr:hypothetical protein [Phycisphaerae bacterium]